MDCPVFFYIKGVCYEITNLKKKQSKIMDLPYSNLVNWYFFELAEVYIIGCFLSNIWLKESLTNPTILFFMTYWHSICMAGWLFGLILFVLSLKKPHYRY